MFQQAELELALVQEQQSLLVSWKQGMFSHVFWIQSGLLSVLLQM